MTLPDGATFTDVSAPFLPSDASTMASQGALKLPDLGPGRTDQLALEGFFAPTGAVQGGILASVDPRPLARRWRSWPTRATSGWTRACRSRCTRSTRPRSTAGALKRVGAANLAAGQS